MANFLEQLVAEWYEFNGNFVRRNILVGPRQKGGWDCELDIVAFNPEKKRLIHVEPSMDAQNWIKREQRYRKKFEAGRRYIPNLFVSLKPLPEIEQVALLVFGSKNVHQSIGGGQIWMMKDFMKEVRVGIQQRSIARSSIPEQYVILRSLLFASEYWK